MGAGAAPRVVAAAGLVLLTGCAGFEPATPPEDTGPTVNVADQVVAISPQRLHVFEITQVEGRRLASSSIATRRANEGRGWVVNPVALTNEVPQRPSRLRLQATTQYAAPILALTQPTCQAQGEVSFAPEAGKTYRVTGRIAADACEAWIEELGSGRAVTDKVTGKGLGS